MNLELVAPQGKSEKDFFGGGVPPGPVTVVFFWKLALREYRTTFEHLPPAPLDQVVFFFTSSLVCSLIFSSNTLRLLAVAPVETASEDG
jgi:hypothetical protein